MLPVNNAAITENYSNRYMCVGLSQMLCGVFTKMDIVLNVVRSMLGLTKMTTSRRWERAKVLSIYCVRIYQVIN